MFRSSIEVERRLPTSHSMECIDLTKDEKQPQRLAISAKPYQSPFTSEIDILEERLPVTRVNSLEKKLSNNSLISLQWIKDLWVLNNKISNLCNKVTKSHWMTHSLKLMFRNFLVYYPFKYILKLKLKHDFNISGEISYLALYNKVSQPHWMTHSLTQMIRHFLVTYPYEIYSEIKAKTYSIFREKLTFYSFSRWWTLSPSPV